MYKNPKWEKNENEILWKTEREQEKHKPLVFFSLHETIWDPLLIS